MRKRLLGLLLVMVMMFTMLPGQAFAADPEEGAPIDNTGMEVPASEDPPAPAEDPAVDPAEDPAERICEEGCILEGEEEHLENGGECFVWIPCTLTEGCEGPDGHADECYGAALYAGELPIHFFLASPGNITNPNGSYINYYGPSGSANNWDGAWTVANIKQNASWSTMYTQTGIRNVSEESIVTQYIASYPNGHSAASFKSFGSVTINGTVYRDTEYEIKWVSIMCRDNKLSNRGMNCNQYNFRDEHIHVDGLLVKKVQPGEMEVFKAIPASAVSQTAATSFHFKLEKMLQASLTTPPTSADAVDTGFAPLTLTATIPAGKTEAQITGGSEITFGYYKLTEIGNQDWQMAGISLTNERGQTQTSEANALYICIAPNGTVQYSTSPSGPYTVMRHVSIENERKPATVTYEWKIFNTDGTYTTLPVGAPDAPASVTDIKIGSQYVYDTEYVTGTSFYDYDNGLLYTFHGWDTYSHSGTYNPNPGAGYHALDDGDSNAANNPTIEITANTYIYGYWTVTELEPSAAHIAIEKVFIVDGVETTPSEAEDLWFLVDTGIDRDDDGDTLIEVTYSMLGATGEYKIPVYQYDTPFVFTEYNSDIPGYTRTTTIAVNGNHVENYASNGNSVTVTMDPVYQGENIHLGTVTYTNTYTKNVGTAVTEYPTLTLVKRATDTGDLQAGAVFTLYGDEACTEALASFTTDAEGRAVIDFKAILEENSDIDTVYLKETAAPEGYLVKETVYTLTLTKSEQETLRGDAFVTVTSYSLAIAVPADSDAKPLQSLSDGLGYLLNVVNDPIRGTLTVVKEAEGLAEGDKAALSAAVTIHGPISRDNDGKITALGGTYVLTLHEDNGWTGIQRDLPIGEYLIHENAALIHGYTWKTVDYGSLEMEVYNDINSAVFEVTAQSTELSITITNEYAVWEEADFEIFKTAPNGTGLSGASFTLYSDEALTNAVQTHVTAANGYAFFGGFTVSAEDPDGIATYYLKETAAPTGYYLSDTVYKVEIKAVSVNGVTGFETKISVKGDSGWVEAPGFNKTADTLIVVNEPVKGEITITKQMLGAPADLTSVSFYVTGPNGYAKTVTLSGEGAWSTKLTDLPLGEYTIIESEADAVGYSLITTYSVNGGAKTTDKAVVELKETVGGNTSARGVIAAAVDIENQYTRNDVYYDVPTTLTVKKVGEAGETLAGAVFRLDRMDASGKNVIHSEAFTTGANGTVTFELLIGLSDDEGNHASGTYILSEVEAPEGYEKTNTTWTVTVKDDDGAVRVVLNENQNVFENFWDWVVGNTNPGVFENGILTVTNEKKLGSLYILKNAVDPKGLYADAEYTFTLDFSDDTFDQTFTLKNGESVDIQNIPWGTTYTLTEDTTGAAFTGAITDEGNGRIWEHENRIIVTNTYAYATHNQPLSLVKVDADDNSKVISGAGFTLFADAELSTKVGTEVFSNDNGALKLPIAEAGTYYLVETTTPEGYHPNANVYVVTAEEKAVVLNAGTADAVTELQMHIRITGLTGNTSNQIDYSYQIENTAIKTAAVTVTKIWDDGTYHARPDSVEVTLYRDNEAFDTVTLNDANNWQHTWGDLTDEYRWSVDEVNIPDQYSKTIENDGNDWVITNTRTPKPVEISVTKAWKHNGGKVLPESITVTLYRNGEAYDRVTLSEENSWTHSWTNLNDASRWSVDEADVPAGYTKEIAVDGYKFAITNTRTINPVEVSVTKVWEASEGVIHPESVEAVLYRDGKAHDTVVLNADNQWSHNWTGLTDEYTWSVDEKSVPEGYTKNVTSEGNNFTITNTKEFSYIDISVNKVWYGADVTHPTSVNVTLYRNGEEFETVTLDASNGWHYTWEELTDEFEWTVDEPSVPSGYNKTVRQDGWSFTVVNTHEDNPKTGDFTNLPGMGILTALSLLSLGFCLPALFSRRRKKEN